MDLRKEIREHKVRTLKTFVLCLMFVGLGIYGATPGVTLLDLGILTDTNVSEIANILPARSGGYAAGALISGFITDYLDHQIVLMLSLVVSIVTFSALPYFQSINIMYAIIFFAGVSAGCIDTVGNVYTIYLWRKKAAPFIQVVHFAFGLGAFISPMIANPFLLDATEEIQEFGRDVSKSYSNFSTITLDGLISIEHDHSSHVMPYNATNKIPWKPTAEDLKIHWAYIIISIFNLSVLIFFLIVYWFRPVTKEYPSEEVPSESTPQKKEKAEFEKSISANDDLPIKNDKSLEITKSTNNTALMSTPMKLLVMGLSIIFFHLYCGLEISFGSLLAPFAVKSNLRMTKAEGAFITSTYWGMFTFFRIFSLFAITFFSTRCILIFNMSLIMLSNVFLLPLANDYRWALWLGSGLMGLGCSSVFATMFGFVEELTPVTPRFTSLTMIACCLGEFILPLTVGIYLDTKPEVFLYVIFIYSVLSLIFLIVLFVIHHYVFKKQKAKCIQD